VIEIPMRTVPGQNVREHHHVRARRVKAEKQATAWSLVTKGNPNLPLTVRLTRLSPGMVPLDDDNLAGSLKAVRDAVAQWLGVDDRHSKRVRYVYTQERRAEWGVRIEFGKASEEPAFLPIEVTA
jgi:hypothetical protein